MTKFLWVGGQQLINNTSATQREGGASAAAGSPMKWDTLILVILFIDLSAV